MSSEDLRKPLLLLLGVGGGSMADFHSPHRSYIGSFKNRNQILSWILLRCNYRYKPLQQSISSPPQLWSWTKLMSYIWFMNQGSPNHELFDGLCDVTNHKPAWISIFPVHAHLYLQWLFRVPGSFTSSSINWGSQRLNLGVSACPMESVLLNYRPHSMDWTH